MKMQLFTGVFRWPVFLLALLTVCMQACKDDNDGPEATVRLNNNATLGNHLVDSKGKTLYVFSRDVSGNSACEGNCLTVWPVYYEANLIPAQGLDAADFGTITRSDGQKQTTFRGWPLYYYAQDAAAGEAKGENVNQVWFVAKPDYSLMVASRGNRKYLVDVDGKTLYLFTNDTPGVSNCSGGCVGVWPLFSAETVVAPSLLASTDFKTITRTDGQKQLTYKNVPLYYFASDAARGDTTGGGVNKKWYTVVP